MNKKIAIILALFVSFFANSKEIVYTTGKTIKLDLSIINPNYFEIDGDIITKIVSVNNKITANGTTGGGSIVIINEPSPFTFLIETQKGLIIPVESIASYDSSGEFIKIIPNEIKKSVEAKKWENKGGSYESNLINIAKGILSGSSDFESQKATKNNTPEINIAGMSINGKSIYQGLNSYIIQYEVKNISLFDKVLDERMINIPKLKAVFFDKTDLTLKPKDTINLYVVVNVEDK